MTSETYGNVKVWKVNGRMTSETYGNVKVWKVNVFLT